MEEMDNQKRQGMLRQRISTCFGAFFGGRRNPEIDPYGRKRNPAIDTCDRDVTKVKKHE